TSGISDQVAYAVNYQNTGIGIHPSEPNYIWAEAGDNLGVLNNNDPYHRAPVPPAVSPAYCSPDSVRHTTQPLITFLTRARRSWRSYQEDANVDLSTNIPLPRSSWTVPLFRFSSGSKNNPTGNPAQLAAALPNYPVSGRNTYNYSTQFDYAPKHNPMVFFTDT